MATKRKRTKSVNEILDSVNQRLKISKVKDSNNPLAIWIADFLISKRMYDGYGYFREKFTEDGTSYNYLDGIENSEYIQFY